MDAIEQSQRVSAESQILNGIANQNRNLILGVAEYKQIRARDTVIQRGAKASHLFLLALGNAKYYRVTKQGKELLVRWLVPGDVFGLATLLNHPPPYMGSVETADECGVYVWKHAILRDLCSVYPQIAQNALRITLG